MEYLLTGLALFAVLIYMGIINARSQKKQGMNLFYDLKSVLEEKEQKQ